MRKLLILLVGICCQAAYAQKVNDMPAFVYYMTKTNMQVVYWEPVNKTEDSDLSWEIQNDLRQNASRYTKLLMDGGKMADVKFAGEVLKDDMGEDALNGSLRNQWYAMQGLKYQFVYPKKVKVVDDPFMPSFHLLLTPEYLKTHPQLPITELKNNEGGYTKEMPSAIVKQLEKRFGMKADKSTAMATFGGRYTYGIVQFKPVGNKVLALDVLVDKDKPYCIQYEGQYEGPDSFSVWNVDDGGEYFPSYILGAFQGADGPEFYFTRWAPESCVIGTITLKNKTMSRYDIGIYYVYAENPQP